MRNRSKILFLACTALALSGCGPKRQAAGLMDDARVHAQRGKQYIDARDLVRARDEFRLSLELDAKYAPALAGLAIVEAREGRFDEASKKAEAAVSASREVSDGFVARAIVIAESHRAKDSDEWLPSAEDEFEKALKRGEKNPETWLRRAQVRQMALHLKEAGEAYRKVLEIDGDFTEAANVGWARLQKIERAAPTTRVGKRIALSDTLTRSDAAVLYIAELQLDRILSRTRGEKVDTAFRAPGDPRDANSKDSAKQVAPDIASHWAKNFIQDALKLGMRGLQLGPDGNFRPGQALNRAEFALLAEDALMAALGDKTLATRYIGSPPRFSDVSAGSPYFNAVCDAVDHNVMNPNSDGSFGALAPVSGADALLTIRLIKDLRK